MYNFIIGDSFHRVNLSSSTARQNIRDWQQWDLKLMWITFLHQVRWSNFIQNQSAFCIGSIFFIAGQVYSVSNLGHFCFLRARFGNQVSFKGMSKTLFKMKYIYIYYQNWISGTWINEKPLLMGLIQSLHFCTEWAVLLWLPNLFN